MKIALITGASSGLGVKYAEAVIEKYPNLDEIWIVARRKDRMEQFAKAHPECKIRPVPMDLTKNESFSTLKTMLDNENASIRVLINNAGNEKSGRFVSLSEETILSVVDVNVRAFTMINRICLPFMHAGSIGIMTSSVGSFTPTPYEGLYCATKSYIMYLSRALHEEMKADGIKILAICPGNMDTEMNPKGQGRISKKLDVLPYLDMDKLTRKSLDLAEKGTCVYTPGLIYKLNRLACKLTPQAITAKFAKLMY